MYWHIKKDNGGRYFFVVSNHDNPLSISLSYYKYIWGQFVLFPGNFILTTMHCFPKYKTSIAVIISVKVLSSDSCMLWLSNHVRPEAVFPLLSFSCQRLRTVLFRRKIFSLTSVILSYLIYFACCGIWIISHFSVLMVSCGSEGHFGSIMTTHSFGDNLSHLALTLSV